MIEMIDFNSIFNLILFDYLKTEYLYPPPFLLHSETLSLKILIIVEIVRYHFLRFLMLLFQFTYSCPFLPAIYYQSG